MGQTLSSPATTKVSESGQDDKYVYAISEMQGWRISMEDAHAAVLKLDEDSENPNTFFAVYDGHGGGTVARFAGQNVHKRLVTEEAYKEKRYDAALKRAFLGTDEDMLADPTHAQDPSGCTAVAALIADNKIYVANAGDSRSVISIKGEVKPLSFDHKPTNDGEKARISSAGGYVEYGRVNGNLALSRAIGDFSFKKNYSLTPEQQIITSDPDITIHDITDEDEFLIIACDGIWDCLSSQQVVNFVRYEVSQGKELKDIGEAMCDHCLAPDTSSGAGIGCDNMTVLIVALLNGKTKEQWYEWMKERVSSRYGYDTPSQHPQLYAASRLASFRARQQGQAARDNRAQHEMVDNTAMGFLNSAHFSEFTRVLGSTGGISFQPGGSIMSDSGHLMFGGDDSDEDEDRDDDMSTRPFYSQALGLGQSNSPESRGNALKAKIEQFEREMQEDGLDDEIDSQTSDTDIAAAEDDTFKPMVLSSEHLNGNGNVMPEKQLESQPGGDEASPVVKMEGLMDTSEDPTKV